MNIKKSLLAVATTGAVTFAGAGVAAADTADLSSGDSDITSSLVQGDDNAVGSFAGDEWAKTLGNITAVISLITAGIGLGSALDIRLPELPF
jgi:hypothetical protein